MRSKFMHWSSILFLKKKKQTVLMVFHSCYSRNDSVILHSDQENIVSLAVLNCIYN